MNRLLLFFLLVFFNYFTVIGQTPSIGERADIASSAYIFSVDRQADANPPESWFALVWFSGQPMNKILDIKSPAIKTVLKSLLWEEIRRVQTLELSWENIDKMPKADEIEITTLEKKNTASSWWNNLITVKKNIRPTISEDGKTLVYQFDSVTNVNAVIVSVKEKDASAFSVPAISVYGEAKWKKMNVEIEWGYDASNEQKDYSGYIEAYDGIVDKLSPLRRDRITKIKENNAWTSAENARNSRGISFQLNYIGTTVKRKIIPYISQQEDVDRTIVTLWTKAGNFSFLAADLEKGPIYAPEYNVFIKKAGTSTNAKEYINATAHLKTVREKIRTNKEQTTHHALEGILKVKVDTLAPFPKAPPEFEAKMKINIPDKILNEQWNITAWHLLRRCEKDSLTGRLLYNDFPYGVLAAETYLMLAALDYMGMHKEAEDGYHQWLKLPTQPFVTLDQIAGPKLGDSKRDKHFGGSFQDRPTGNFSDGYGSFTLAEGVPGVAGHLDGVHAYGPGCIGWAINEHYLLTKDNQWLNANVERIKANVEWMLRQRQFLKTMVPGGERLWGKGLQPALEATPDSQGMFMQWYWSEAFYYATVARFVELLKAVDKEAAAKLQVEVDHYKKDIIEAVDRSIALSPMVQTDDGAYHSVIPFACYMRGLGTGAWGWDRNGSDGHWGMLTFETDLSSSPLISVAGIYDVHDKRIQGYLDVLEDKLLVNNPRTDSLSWEFAGWQHQVGIQKTIDAHLLGDDIPVFIRSFLNSYAIHIVPQKQWVFNEHVFGGPPDKIFEDAAFAVRLRNMLLMEENDVLWLGRGVPRAWMEQGKTISVNNAPTYFGILDYTLTSDVDNNKIVAKVQLAEKGNKMYLRVRHPQAHPIKSVVLDGKEWKSFSAENEWVELPAKEGQIKIECIY